MEEFMRSILGSAWAYYVAFGILLVWWVIERSNRKK